ncbi:MAG: alpha-amylase, partial [Candidatus Riflebacteria bacterium]|nr:alpha-amylase [Candidatus Riflebacteria bacterium]
MSHRKPAGPLPVTFTYYTGLADVPFGNAWLVGTWNVQGLYSEQESSRPMEPVTGEDGCPAFRATVTFAASEAGKEFRWKVLLDTPGGPNAHAVPTEENDPQSRHRHRRFVLGEDGPGQEYHLSLQRRLGANKLWAEGAKEPGIRFSVWAPNARLVETVLVDRATGYVADDGTGVTGVFPMTRNPEGIWDTDFASSPALRRFADFVGLPYMFRVTRDDGSVVYRTDLYSRQQIGRGDVDPHGKPYTGRSRDLDGRVGASVVVDPDQVRETLAIDEAGETLIPAHDFWAHEFNHLKPLPSRIEDLVVYQLHVGALGFGRAGPGNLADAVAFIDHLESLGVNAVELLPINEFPGKVGWGYGTTHFFAIEQSAGGRDHLKHFVRECHRRGIAVILDVVYNHYPPDADRAQWQYDSVQPERNMWYWYEGNAADYPDPNGGYIDNISSGFAPRFCEEQVRRCFISSAVSLAAEFHVDGFRMDQVTSLHAYPVVHANGEAAHHARIFGTKFLREWNRTLKLVKPPLVTHAEDHSLWYLVTLPTT